MTSWRYLLLFVFWSVAGAGAQVAPPSRVLPQAQPATRPLRVNTPAALKWRLAGRVTWQSSGDTISVAPGEYLIECQPVQPGQAVPPPVRILIGAGTTLETRAVPSLPIGGARGALAVIIGPESVASSALREERGQWRFVGETSDAQWRNGGLASLPLDPGAYVIEFRPVSGKVSVTTRTVVIQPKETTQVRVFYEDETAISPSAIQPAPIAANELDLPPYCFSGQLLTDAGSGSGTVVKARVVLTAAHVVFDDVALTYTTGMKWLFQRQRGSVEPAALVPRGGYVFNSYSQVRLVDRVELGVGQATQRSQQRDAAGLYFTREAGRFGFAEVLATGDTPETEWLANLDAGTSQPRKKTLVSYPVDLNFLEQNGYSELDAGKMFRTAAAPAAFTKVTAEGLPTGVVETDSRLETNRVYQATALAGYAGSSGGGLWVQYDDGEYYPAGIYVGGTDRCVVRAIDAPTVDLIGRADLSSQSASDQNNTGGGITRVSSLVTKATFTIARVQVSFTGLDPGDQSKASWMTSGSSLVSRAGEVRFLVAGQYLLHFAKVAGYREPSAFQVSVRNTDDLVIEAQYVKRVAPTITTAALQRAVAGQPYSFQLQAAGGATSYQVTSQEIAGLQVSAKGRLTIPMVAAQPGDYRVTVRAVNEVGAMSRSFQLPVVMKGHLEIRHRDVSDPLSTRDLGAKIDGSFETRIVGDTVTLMAVPQKGLIFKQWTGFGIENLPSAKTRLSFTMRPVVTLYAEFVRNPFTPRAATYAGGLQEEAPRLESTGLVQLTLTAGGTFTGKAVLAGRTCKLGGKFNVDGTFRGQVSRPKAGAQPAEAPLDLELQFDATTDDGAMRGTLTGEYTSGSALRTAVPFTVRRLVKVGGAKRTYTLVMPADPTVAAGDLSKPHGAGAASLVLSPNGGMRTTVLLADGSSAIIAGWMTGSEPGAPGAYAMALFTPLYKAHGSLSATLVLDLATQKLTGAAHWFRDAIATQTQLPRLSGSWPGGLNSTVQGELFPAPSLAMPLLANFRARVDGLYDQITLEFDPAQNRFVNGILSVTGAFGLEAVPAAGFTMKIDPKTGLIRGTYQPPLPGGGFGIQENFTGAVLRSENRAVGASLSIDPVNDPANVTWELRQRP